MGRSVDVPRDAGVVVYQDWSQLNDEFDWFDRVEHLLIQFFARYPSFYRDNRWLDREQHVVATNGSVDLVLCEYCGLVSISLVPVVSESWFPGDVGRENFAKAWIARVADGFNDVFGELRRVGRFCNGEVLFQSHSN